LGGELTVPRIGAGSDMPVGFELGASLTGHPVGGVAAGAHHADSAVMVTGAQPIRVTENDTGWDGTGVDAH